MQATKWLLLGCVVVGLVSGCASGSVPVLTGETLMLGEVRHVLTRELLHSGQLTPGGERQNLSGLLKARGWSEEELDEGRLFVVRKQIYWNNTASGILRNHLDVVRLNKGQTVSAGNVVEFAATSDVRRVRAPSLAEGGCYYGNVPVGGMVEALGAMSMVGPRGSASLYCRGIEFEGWHRPRTLWHRLPDAIPGAEPIDKRPIEVPLPAGG